MSYEDIDIDIEDLFNNKYEFSGESLRAQMNDKDVKHMEMLVGKILGHVHSDITFRNRYLRDDPVINKIVVELEEAIWNRFGIPIRIIGSDSLAYTIPITGPTPNIIMGDKINIVEILEDIRTKYCPSSKSCDFKHIDISKASTDKDIFKNDDNIGHYLGSAYKMMNDILGKRGIKVDYNKIKISGLEEAKKHKRYVIMGLNFLEFANRNFTARKIFSIMLHELGHTFNELAYFNVYAQTSLPVIESVLDEKLSTNQKIVKAYKAITGEETTLTEALKKLPVLYIKHVKESIGRESAKYNNEIFADRFATKFGYGEDVVMALNDMGVKHDRYKYPLLRFLTIIVSIIIIVILSMMTGMFIILIPYFIIIFISLLTLNFIMPSIQNLEDVHEQSFTRTRRVKLELIREYRTAQIPAVKEYLKPIIALDKWLDNNQIDKRTSQIIFTIIKGDREEVGFHELYQRLEQLSENDLHMLSFKLNTLKGSKK